MNSDLRSPRVPTLAAALLLSSLPAGASVVIDDFSLDSDIVINAGGSPIPESDAQPVTILGQNATRTFSGGATTGEFQVQIREHAFGYASNPGATGNASLAYTGFSVDLTTNPYLRLDFTGILGTGSFVVELQTPSTTLGHLPMTLQTAASKTLFLDTRQFAGYQDGALTGVNQFLFAVEGVGEPPFFMQLGGISFVSSDEMLLAIPEPSSARWVMGGLLGLGALLHRRRKNSHAAASRN